MAVPRIPIFFLNFRMRAAVTHGRWLLSLHIPNFFGTRSDDVPIHVFRMIVYRITMLLLSGTS